MEIIIKLLDKVDKLDRYVLSPPTHRAEWDYPSNLSSPSSSEGIK